MRFLNRGASAFSPENTLESFRLAIEKFKVDMIEFDVRPTKEGIPVVFHDHRLERTTNGKGLVSQYTLEELQNFDAGYHFDPENQGSFPLRGKGIKIPPLEKVVTAFPQTSLAIEIKENTKSFTDQVMTVIKKHQADERCTVGSKYHSVSSIIRKNYAHIHRFCSRVDILSLILEYRSKKSRPSPDPYAVASVPTRFFGIHFNTSGWIEFLHAKYMKSYFWTIDDLNEIRNLIHLRTDGIVTNNPDLVSQALDSSHGTAPKGD